MRLEDKTATLKKFEMQEVIPEGGGAAPRASARTRATFEIRLMRDEVVNLGRDMTSGFSEDAAALILSVIDSFGEDGAKGKGEDPSKPKKKKSDDPTPEKAKLNDLKISNVFAPVVLRVESDYASFRFKAVQYRHVTIKPMNGFVIFTFKVESIIQRSMIADMGISLGLVRLSTAAVQPPLALVGEA